MQGSGDLAPRKKLPLAVTIVKLLARGRVVDIERLQRYPTEPLYDLLRATIRDAESAVIRDEDYTTMLGVSQSGPVHAADVWKHLAGLVGPSGRSRDPALRPALDTIFERGPLARRILDAFDSDFSRARIAAVYRGLCASLAAGKMFSGLE